MSLSQYVSSLRGMAWGSRSFFLQLNPHWVLQPEVMETYLMALEPWAGGSGVGLLIPKISLLNFYPLHMDVGPAHSTFLPLLPVWMYVVSLIL